MFIYLSIITIQEKDGKKLVIIGDMISAILSNKTFAQVITQIIYL